MYIDNKQMNVQHCKSWRYNASCKHLVVWSVLIKVIWSVYPCVRLIVYNVDCWLGVVSVFDSIFIFIVSLSSNFLVLESLLAKLLSFCLFHSWIRIHLVIHNFIIFHHHYLLLYFMIVILWCLIVWKVSCSAYLHLYDWSWNVLFNWLVFICFSMMVMSMGTV